MRYLVLPILFFGFLALAGANLIDSQQGIPEKKQTSTGEESLRQSATEKAAPALQASAPKVERSAMDTGKFSGSPLQRNPAQAGHAHVSRGKTSETSRETHSF